MRVVRDKAPTIPPERAETARDAIRRVLTESPATAREISQLVGISERDVVEHLGHLERTLRHGANVLAIEPPECTACGFVFTRTRTSRPSRCPKCRSERISPPRFWIQRSR